MAVQGQATQSILNGCGPPPSATIVRAVEFHAAGGYDPRLPCRNDLDFHLRLSLRGPWLYVPGEPVVMRRGIHHVLGSPPHLTADINSRVHRVYGLYVLEDFFLHKGGGQSLPHRRWTRMLASRWRHMGKEMMSDGKKPEAAWCLRRSLSYRPWRSKYWMMLLIGGDIKGKEPDLPPHLKRPHLPPAVPVQWGKT